ncbi:hypothetical protein GSY74_00805 [Sulfurovum sp. bin170]|uniref:hypothetical protein n=1 Tax=Sulfurovum sp. bin170 TaxID=2695268 RepID=UPI0013E097F9|nr:hypothetical protein [Sulfurovum sp. bin170]NEW59807.1 hypothetical protein [Sulfurovum sp. bin170]
MKKTVFTISLLTALTQAHIDDKVLYAFEAKCMGCHDTYKKNKLAPPLVAVNQVYLRLTDNNMSEAMEHMKKFLSMPSEDKTLMKPAVKLFGVMPKMDFNETEIEDFSQVLVETEFEIPDWFNEHYRSHELNKTE